MDQCLRCFASTTLFKLEAQKAIELGDETK
jgi:hypothetical protein